MDFHIPCSPSPLWVTPWHNDCHIVLIIVIVTYIQPVCSYLHWCFDWILTECRFDELKTYWTSIINTTQEKKKSNNGEVKTSMNRRNNPSQSVPWKWFPQRKGEEHLQGEITMPQGTAAGVSAETWAGQAAEPRKQATGYSIWGQGMKDNPQHHQAEEDQCCRPQ